MAETHTNSVAKGKRIELQAVHFLRDIGFPDAERTAQHSGNETADIRCPKTLPRAHIEVKGDQRIGLGTIELERAFEKASNDCAEGSIPVVLWRRKRTSWRLTFILPKPLCLATVHRAVDIAFILRSLGGSS